jgi:hypothetical protein
MMRRGLVICVGLLFLTQTASADTRVYVSGDLFAEITRLSRTIGPDSTTFGDIADPGDGVTIGGGGRIGAFFAPSWSLELGLDVAKEVSEERTLSLRPPIGLALPAPSLRYQSRTRHRFSASSVLLGYHPATRGRIQAGFRGGVSFMHVERSLTSASISTVTVLPTLPGGLPASRIDVVTSEFTFITNGLSGTVAAEAAIGVSSHFAVVPEVRVLAGGLGGILIRPGFAARWRW